MARPKIVAGNWKMNLDLAAAQALTSEIVQILTDESSASAGVQVVICPSAPLLMPVGRLLEGRVALGAQNAHHQTSGAYTGEVAAGLLASVGCKYVILGHSERRQYNGETDELLAQKLPAAFAAGLKPLFCIGETLAEREADQTFVVLERQLKNGLFGISAADFANATIAYEPVWAIGTGRTATSAQAQEVHAFIRAQVAAQYGAAVADATAILYGGSCNAQNARELFAQPDVDGGLIGGAALKARDFVTITQSF
jgi:triosephosphate isomerase (TIM)